MLCMLRGRKPALGGGRAEHIYHDNRLPCSRNWQPLERFNRSRSMHRLSGSEIRIRCVHRLNGQGQLMAW